MMKKIPLIERLKLVYYYLIHYKSKNEMIKELKDCISVLRFCHEEGYLSFACCQQIEGILVNTNQSSNCKIEAIKEVLKKRNDEFILLIKKYPKLKITEV